MNTDHVVARASRPASGPDSFGLPSDLLDSAAHRLGLAALVYAGVFAVTTGVGSVLMGPPGSGAELAIVVTFVLGSLLVFGMTRTHLVAPQRMLDFGLVYEVIAAFGIEVGMLFVPDILVEQLAQRPEEVLPNGISWVCVWMVTFPMLVPSTTGKTLLAALGAASMRPLVLLILAARGIVMPLSLAAQFVIPNYICVVIAVVAARVVYGLGRKVREARLMGSYRLVELLGRGGMGEVWRAEHHMLARPAAIKLIRPESLGTMGEDHDTIVRRFEREARATALLSSPHTIQLHDFGVTSDGTFYYVMELLHGMDLEAMVRRFGAVPAARAVFLLQQVCASLGEAHQHGLVHRDVKPANIYLCRIGRDFDFVKVLDFGLVKAAGANTAETALTGRHVAAGTPAYMAPETVMGERSVDGRADVYAVGCVAYWMLTGKLVFEGQTAMQQVVAHAERTPEPPSARCENVIPAAFEAVIMSCLAKDPAQRPQTTDELADRLAACVEGDPWTPRDGARWWNTHLPQFTALSGSAPRSSPVAAGVRLDDPHDHQPDGKNERYVSPP